MTAIYLMHPRHGIKIATMELEAQYDEQNGWVRFDPADMVEEASAEPDLPDTELDANLMTEAPRRRGRPRASKDG